MKNFDKKLLSRRLLPFRNRRTLSINSSFFIVSICIMSRIRHTYVTALTTGIIPARFTRTNNSHRLIASFTSSTVRFQSSKNDPADFVDESGRRIRSRANTNKSSSKDEWGNIGRGASFYDDDDDNYNDDKRRMKKRNKSTSSWDDFDPWINEKNGSFNNDDWGVSQSTRERSSRSQNRERHSTSQKPRGERNRDTRKRRDFDDFDNGLGNKQFEKKNRNKNWKDSNHDEKSVSRSINMNALEGAGYVHLYGLSSVFNALVANRRDFKTSVEKNDQYAVNDARFSTNFDPDFDDMDDFEDDTTSTNDIVEVKPQAQFRPYLFVQEQRESGRRGSKASTAQKVLQLAEERNIPIAYVDKGILNTLAGNRPHQGFVLRCGKLSFESLSRIPLPSSDDTSSPSLWLVLDEVVDPQNLGALLRSAYFLGGGNLETNPKVGVLVCSKNSAPPSPVVSASSAGALEVLVVYSTTNLPRTLNQAREDGFRVIGASSSIPQDTSEYLGKYSEEEEGGPPQYDLQNLPPQGANDDDRPILLVLGSEGHGLRKLVAKTCTEFVRIPSRIYDGRIEGTTDYDDNDGAGVDSLNVSVTGGIMLWHLLNRSSR